MGQNESKNESKKEPIENKDDTDEKKAIEKDDVARYIINCKADKKQPKFFSSESIKSIVSSVINYGESIFGYDLEIYDVEKGFETKKVSAWGRITDIKNQLILALHCAFMHHLPFQLRPDDIWIIIAQGIAAHIEKNAEKLRDKFVDFDGKKAVKVRDDSLDINSENNDWSFVLKQFDEGCRKLTNNDVVDLMTNNFSTTSIITATASKCVLFKAMSEYIDFSTDTESGIPQITLVGSVDDWKKVEAKCLKLKEMKIGLDFWLEFLMPLVNNIVETTVLLNKGKKLNKELKYFWDSIYHYQSNSGGDAVSGWVKTLFPYDIRMNKNSELKWDYSDKQYGEWADMSPGDFPASYSRAPMIWNYFGNEKKCGMYGGIFGIAQQGKTGCIAPVIGWTIAGE